MDKGTLVGLIFGAFGGGWLTSMIQTFFEHRYLKTERKSALNKEIYFRKVEAWERVCTQMTMINTEISQYISALSGEQVFLAKIGISMDERIKDLSVLEAWFSKDVRDSWNKINEPYNIIRSTYLLAQEGKMTDLQAKECIKAIKPFQESLTLVKKAISLELESDKAKIIE